ncbi:hypothetical protein [Methylobacterium symbioticum]|uniref:Cellulose biosynthesis protein BcsN n=1 Tax=Methylobacterium symbioticum TaxID=2584084 RepID=A0A509EB69_9HYPH|nr:hypothetical protein [Methylobacterium symbioticum]VUD71441.1 hypothetical protein MET9862_02023 [Methylobacterium symbioticum]
MSRTASAAWPRLAPQHAVALLAWSLLTACTTASGQRADVRHLDTAFSVGDVSARTPLITVPQSGPGTLQETRLAGGLRQQITYAGTAGFADLVVVSRQAGIPRVEKPTRAGIAAELAALGGDYRVLKQPFHNAYGQIGIAVSGRCAYGWQWIDDLRGVDLGRPGLNGGPFSASLRVKHCARASASEDALVGPLLRVRLGMRDGEPARAAPRRPKVVTAAPAPAPAEPRPPRTAPASPSVAINDNRTLISLPPSGTGPAYLAPPAIQNPAQASPVSIPRPAAMGAPQQPRYLADPGPAPSEPRAVPRAQAVPSPVRPDDRSSNASGQAARGQTPPPFGW